MPALKRPTKGNTMSTTSNSNSNSNPLPEVDASEFIRAHGRAPRGFGSWAFEFIIPGQGRDGDVASSPKTYWVHQSLYAAARRRAVKRARELGALIVVVLS